MPLRLLCKSETQLNEQAISPLVGKTYRESRGLTFRPKEYCTTRSIQTCQAVSLHKSRSSCLPVFEVNDLTETRYLTKSAGLCGSYFYSCPSLSPFLLVYLTKWTEVRQMSIHRTRLVLQEKIKIRNLVLRMGRGSTMRAIKLHRRLPNLSDMRSRIQIGLMQMLPT